MKLASQKDTGSPRNLSVSSRAGTGRKSSALLTAIKSLAADIAAIKLAVVTNEQRQPLQQRPAPAHLARAAAATPVQQWKATQPAQLWTRPTGSGVVPLLQQGDRQPTHAPSSPVSLAHLHDLRTMQAELTYPSASHTPSTSQPVLRVSMSRPAATTYSAGKASDPSDSDAAWRNLAPATAPPLPPEWGLPATEGCNGLAHTNSESQAQEWDGVVLVPGSGRLQPIFSRGVLENVGLQARPRQQAVGQSVSWAVALEAALDSDAAQ